jgi:hypothetical protein
MLLRDCDFQVFRAHYNHTVHHRTPTFGGMDSEYSHSEQVKSSCLVVAPSSVLARALFETQYGNTRELTEVETVGQVEIMIRG